MSLGTSGCASWVQHTLSQSRTSLPAIAQRGRKQYSAICYLGTGRRAARAERRVEGDLVGGDEGEQSDGLP
eukprot:1765258-Rhodomonas_salina.1